MSGDHARALTQGLPLIWNAGLVWLRVQQLTRVVERRTLGQGEHSIATSPLAQRCFDALELVRLPWKTWSRVGSRTFAVLPRPLIACPDCGVPAWRLIAKGRAWACRRCYGGPLDGWHQAHCTDFTRTEILLGDYACGVRIGLTGGPMLKRRRFLLERLKTRHLQHGRTPEDLAMLALGGPILSQPPFFNRTGNRGLGPASPVFLRLAPHVMPLAIEHLLHPQAYLSRFAGL